MFASNSLGAVDKQIFDKWLHIILDSLKSDSEAGFALTRHREALVVAVESFRTKVGAPTGSNGPVESKSTVARAVVIVSDESRAAVLTEDGEGLPEVDVICVDGAARDMSVVFLMEHARRIVFEEVTLNAQLLVLQLLGLLDDQVPDLAAHLSVLVAG